MLTKFLVSIVVSIVNLSTINKMRYHWIPTIWLTNFAPVEFLFNFSSLQIDVKFLSYINFLNFAFLNFYY